MSFPGNGYFLECMILKQHGTHTTSCKRDKIKISLRKFRENVTDRAKFTQESTDIVLTQCMSQLSDAERIRLPPLDHVKRTIQKQRKKMIYHKYQMILIFLMFQSFYNQPNEMKIFYGLIQEQANNTRFSW
jgi:hypothetical protein